MRMHDGHSFSALALAEGGRRDKLSLRFASFDVDPLTPLRSANGDTLRAHRPAPHLDACVRVRGLDSRISRGTL